MGYKAANIRQLSPTTKIVMLSMHNSSAAAEEAFRAGVALYVTKSETGADFMRTIDALFGDFSRVRDQFPTF
jgi:DNA-binding NarL/FixJ family response regulator